MTNQYTNANQKAASPVLTSILAWINIIFGVLGILSYLCLLVGLFVAISFPNMFSEAPELKEAIDETLYPQNLKPSYIYLLFSYVLACFSQGLVLLVSGLFLLRMRRLGWRLAMWYATFALVLIGAVFAFRYFILLSVLTDDNSPLMAQAISEIVNLLTELILPLLNFLFLLLISRSFASKKIEYWGEE